MIETVHSKYLCFETNNCDPKKILMLSEFLRAWARECLNKNFYYWNIIFQIDASFQNGEEYAVGEEEMYKEKEML